MIQLYLGVALTVISFIAGDRLGFNSHKLKQIEIDNLKKTKEIQEQTMKITELTKASHNVKIIKIRESKIDIKDQEEYFDKTNKLYENINN